MKTITETYEVYTFAELSASAQEKALDALRDLNTDHEWYAMDEIYNEIAKEYGIEIDMNGVSFDLDRGNYVAFDTYNHGQDKNWTCPIVITDERNSQAKPA